MKGVGKQEMGRERKGVRKVQESHHSNRSPLCSEAELPLGKEIKCFLSISVGKVIGDKLLQPKQGWRGWLLGMHTTAAQGSCVLPCSRQSTQDATKQGWAQIGR